MRQGRFENAFAVIFDDNSDAIFLFGQRYGHRIASFWCVL